MSQIVLHQWEMSPFCNKVRRMLRHKGLAYQTIEYNGLLARKAAGLSPQGTLPVLDIDGQRIVDSGAIGRFLDTHYPDPPLWPADPLPRAQARFWEDWADKSFYAYEIYFRMLVPGPLEQALDLISQGRPRWERAVLKPVFRRRYRQKMHWLGLGRMAPEDITRQMLEHLDNLETILASRSWLAGEELSIADMAVAAQLDELLRTSELAPQARQREATMAWLARMD